MILHILESHGGFLSRTVARSDEYGSKSKSRLKVGKKLEMILERYKCHLFN